jgi:dTDP-4-amino-4,6-dideoxygalactose transaminase
MLEIQAAIGRIQLRRMADWTVARTQNADVLRQALAPHSSPRGAVEIPAISDNGSVHAQYKFYAYVQPARLAPGWDRDRIVTEITTGGVPCFQGSCSEVYLEKAFEGTGLRPPERLPIARELGETSIMWLVHPTLTEDEILKTAEVSAAVLERATRQE